MTLDVLQDDKKFVDPTRVVYPMREPKTVGRYWWNRRTPLPCDYDSDCKNTGGLVDRTMKQMLTDMTEKYASNLVVDMEKHGTTFEKFEAKKQGGDFLVMRGGKLGEAFMASASRGVLTYTPGYACWVETKGQGQYRGNIFHEFLYFWYRKKTSDDVGWWLGHAMTYAFGSAFGMDPTVLKEYTGQEVYMSMIEDESYSDMTLLAYSSRVAGKHFESEQVDLDRLWFFDAFPVMLGGSQWGDRGRLETMDRGGPGELLLEGVVVQKIWLPLGPFRAWERVTKRVLLRWVVEALLGRDKR